MNELNAKSAVVQRILEINAKLKTLSQECLELGHICHDECNPPLPKVADDLYMVHRGLKDYINELSKHV